MSRKIKFEDLLDVRVLTKKQREKYPTLASIIDPIRNDVNKNMKGHRSNERIARIVITTFLDVLLKELIYNNETYIFPVKGFGALKIANQTKGIKRYDIKTEGHYYVLKISPGELYKKDVKKGYSIRMSGKYYKMLMDEVNNGHRY